MDAKGKERYEPVKCIVISPPEKVKKEIDFIKVLVEEGLEYYHLRKPGMPEKELESFIQKIPGNCRDKIILHDHYKLVPGYELKGIHITNKTKNEGIEKQYKNYHISISTHSLKELSGLKPLYNYAFLSPVFKSISKANYESPFQLNEIKAYLEQNPPGNKVIALGGIHKNNIKQVLETGFDGFAILGGLWNEVSTNNNLREGINIFRTIQKQLQNHNFKYE
ncbi:MAG: thiamine phosphate synthase [Bacteroidales bacterium]